MTVTVEDIKKKKKKQNEWQEKQEQYNQMIMSMLQSVPGIQLNMQQQQFLMETPRIGRLFTMPG
jgi:hypothetical protein